MKARRMVFPTHYFTLLSEKVEVAQILSQKVNSLGPRNWPRGIGCIVSFSVRISTLERKENHYSNREVDEVDEQKVNIKSQPNKRKELIMYPPYM